MKYLISVLILLFNTTCTTYDNAVIYHKNFQSGTHPLLRFDGYYSDTSFNQFRPVFFYQNGASYSVTNCLSEIDLQYAIGKNLLRGSWGNYLINADTIQLEKFQLKENNYVRIILSGIISKDQIHWTSRKEHNESYKPVDYTIFFKSFSVKPDSTGNFTRTKKKYNP